MALGGGDANDGHQPEHDFNHSTPSRGCHRGEQDEHGGVDKNGHFFHTGPKVHGHAGGRELESTAPVAGGQASLCNYRANKRFQKAIPRFGSCPKRGLLEA